MVLRTVSGTPLFFNFHASPRDGDSEGQRLLGNTAILGQSSGGKTVLLGFLLAQAQKFGPTVVAFDKDRGMEIAIRAMGGRYHTLKVGQPTGWNPLQMEPSGPRVLFMRELVKMLVAGAGERLSIREEQEIEAAVGNLTSHIDRPLRRLSVLSQFLTEGVAARLRKWCDGGAYAWVFDNPTDTLDLTTHRMYGFDLTEFLDNVEVRGPMMKYLVHRTEGMVDGRRFMCVFDEWWKALTNDDFARLSENQGRTIRKQDGVLLLSTQDPHEALRSEAGRASLKQCATLILMRNPRADREDYVDGLKLTETEFELIRTLPEDTRRFLVKQGENSALAELDLGALEAELKVLSGTPDRAAMVEELTKEWGEEPERWLPPFWKRLGVSA